MPNEKRELSAFWRLLAFVICLLIWAAMLGFLATGWPAAARGAPSPLPRRDRQAKKVPDLVGRWKGCWYSDSWNVTLADGGVYEAWKGDHPGNSRYEGTWSLDDGRLTIKERPEGDWHGSYSVYVLSVTQDVLGGFYDPLNNVVMSRRHGGGW